MAGTPKRVLAEHYHISIKSVGRFLAKHGVKRKSHLDIRPDDLPEWVRKEDG